MKTKQSITPGPWQTYQLAHDDKTYGQNAGKLIVVAADGELEVCGVVSMDTDAIAIAALPELIAACVLFENLTRNGAQPGSEDLEQLQEALAKAGQ